MVLEKPMHHENIHEIAAWMQESLRNAREDLEAVPLPQRHGSFIG